eukprot:GFKZ01004944.1.p1 GENE.GFKZ01004944.1~~GFKZ01004944.1.p1  ORF type:complete len:1328 (-),score=145.36 GFKZ01004944.1:1936-5919(-)
MGYFTLGPPKVFAPPSSSSTPLPSVQSLLPSPCDRYLLTVSPSALHIWSASQHRVLLARFLVSPHLLDSEGPFVSAAWHHQSHTVLAALANGLVLIFHVSPHTSHSLLQFNLPAEQQPKPPLIQSSNLHPLRFTRVSELRIPTSAASITAIEPCPVGALISTSASALLCVTWDGETLWRLHLPELLRHNSALVKMGIPSATDPAAAAVLHDIQAGEGDDDLGGIRALDYNAELGFCALVFGNGVALLLGVMRGGQLRPSAIDGRWLRAESAVSVALEPRRMLATVGLADGDVEQYYVGVPAGEVCPVMRRLSLASWYFESVDVGGATVVRWTEDGAAFVVGWEKRGLAVWSVSGCRLMWTLPQVGGGATPGIRKEGKGVGVVTPMEEGVLSAAWGPRGFCLWAAPRCTEGSPEMMRGCQFVEFAFYKGTAGGGMGHGGASKLAMLGGDRVLLLWHAEESVKERVEIGGQGRRELFSWQNLLIPHDYLWRNWPPEKIAVSSDASYVAVAGEYGIAICQVKMQKWRVFGDLEHDRRIKCCALAWVGKTIVVGNETCGGTLRSKSTFELLLYQRDDLESSALLAQKRLPSRPVLTDVRPDGYLLVVCADAQVFLFHMTEYPNRSRTDLRQVYRLLLPTRELAPLYQQDRLTKTRGGNGLDTSCDSPPAPGGGISEARIFPPLSHASSAVGASTPIPRQIMLLRNTGSLILLDTERMVSTALLRYVERFWYTPADCTPFDMISHRPVWWAYGDDGLHVCFHDDVSGNKDFDDLIGSSASDNVPNASPLSYSSRRKGMEVEQWFELDPEVYPLSIMSKYGMLLGATQGLQTYNLDSESACMHSHVIQVKRQPILHTLLRHLLMKPMSDERTALQVALKCVPQPQFADSLEWLLYEAVLEHDEDRNLNINGKTIHAVSGVKGIHQKQVFGPGSTHLTGERSFPESPKRRKAGDDLFPRVIRLLKYFGEYEDIVVRCARKLDSKRWPLLFSVAGEPAALLEQCFVSGRLRTAACLLVILQEMWGFISSTPHSLRLVEAALSRGELALAAELANFLAKADRAGMLNSSQLRTTEDVSWIAEACLAPKSDALDKLPQRRSDREGPANRIPAVDHAVLKHARSLLNKMDLRNLAALAVRMDFPLTEYLKRELKGKNASKPFVRDFGNTILSLHRQFQYPEPDHHDVRRAMRQFNHDVAANGGEFTAIIDEMLPTVTPRSQANNATVHLVGPGADTVFGSQLPPPPTSFDSELVVNIREKARQLCREELSYIMTVARLARAPDIIICCATLLLDISVLKMVLRGHEELFEPYIAALHEYNVSGYNALVAVLNEIAAPR